MAIKRRWKHWPKRFIQKLNFISGLLTLGGAILAVIPSVGGNTFSDSLAFWMRVIGILIMILAVGIAAYQAIPPIIRNPADFLNQRLSLDKLENMDPLPLKLSVVGLQMVGKSTLLNRILHTQPPAQRTQGAHAYIAALQISPIQYLAMLDGSGDLFADQFEIGSLANILCIVLDHNSSESDNDIFPSRIDEHKNFHHQLRGYLASKSRNPIWVHLLMNKHDLWKDSSTLDCDKLTLLLKEEKRNWEKSNLTKKVTSEEYSNHNPDDVVKLLQNIKEFLEEQNGY